MWDVKMSSSGTQHQDGWLRGHLEAETLQCSMPRDELAMVHKILIVPAGVVRRGYVIIDITGYCAGGGPFPHWPPSGAR